MLSNSHAISHILERNKIHSQKSEAEGEIILRGCSFHEQRQFFYCSLFFSVIKARVWGSDYNNMQQLYISKFSLISDDAMIYDVMAKTQKHRNIVHQQFNSTQQLQCYILKLQKNVIKFTTLHGLLISEWLWLMQEGWWLFWVPLQHKLFDLSIWWAAGILPVKRAL